MESVIYPLMKLKRLLGFPYPLDEIGLMVNHFAWHKNHRIDRYFFCFGFNKEKYNPPEIDRRPSFSIISPGSVLNTTAAVPHDELFFSYSRSVSGKLKAVFDSLPPERMHSYFSADEQFERNLKEVRTLLRDRMSLGMVDRLDALAMKMIFDKIGAGGMPESELEPLNTETKLMEIAERLRHGANLETLIHQYGYSRRAFYYEWNRFFSVSPKQMQLEAKLEKARCLLFGTPLSIAEIAQNCGFSSHRYFHECFLKHYLCTPGEYRKRSVPVKK
ncbi:MAG: helix-turn-helix transcriptional regulator [Lentisphaeria bacterium]|nr:helix-turn-helix transcriptional regulator [Lentisphaeria bacterium]